MNKKDAIITVLSRAQLAERWNRSTKTIENMEAEGLITRLPKFPSPTYNIREIERNEGSGLDGKSDQVIFLEKRLKLKDQEIKNLTDKLLRITSIAVGGEM